MALLRVIPRYEAERFHRRASAADFERIRETGLWVGQRQVNQVNGQDPEQNTSSQAVHKVPRAFFNAIREWTFSDLRRLKSHLKFTFDSPRHS
jgi:hypothetical protein